MNRGGAMTGAKWWWVGWSPRVLRWLEPRGGADLQIVVLPKKECNFSGCDMGGGGDTTRW